jgi:tetratricopeptide (TPR) repeat protein
VAREKAAVRANRDAVATRAAAATPTVPKARSYADLSPSGQQEAADLYDKGVAALQSGRRDDAIRYWELVRAVAPDYHQVAENLKQEYLAEGMEAFAGGRLDRSIEIWQKALDIDPDDPRTRGYLARVQEHKSRIGEIQGGR